MDTFNNTTKPNTVFALPCSCKFSPLLTHGLYMGELTEDQLVEILSRNVVPTDIDFNGALILVGDGAGDRIALAVIDPKDCLKGDYDKLIDLGYNVETCPIKGTEMWEKQIAVKVASARLFSFCVYLKENGRLLKRYLGNKEHTVEKTVANGGINAGFIPPVCRNTWLRNWLEAGKRVLDLENNDSQSETPAVDSELAGEIDDFAREAAAGVYSVGSNRILDEMDARIVVPIKEHSNGKVDQVTTPTETEQSDWVITLTAPWMLTQEAFAEWIESNGDGFGINGYAREVPKSTEANVQVHGELADGKRESDAVARDNLEYANRRIDLADYVHGRMESRVNAATNGYLDTLYTDNTHAVIDCLWVFIGINQWIHQRGSDTPTIDMVKNRELGFIRDASCALQRAYSSVGMPAYKFITGNLVNKILGVCLEEVSVNVKIKNIKQLLESDDILDLVGCGSKVEITKKEEDARESSANNVNEMLSAYVKSRMRNILVGKLTIKDLHAGILNMESVLANHYWVFLELTKLVSESEVTSFDLKSILKKEAAYISKTRQELHYMKTQLGEPAYRDVVGSMVVKIIEVYQEKIDQQEKINRLITLLDRKPPRAGDKIVIGNKLEPKSKIDDKSNRFNVISVDELISQYANTEWVVKDVSANVNAFNHAIWTLCQPHSPDNKVCVRLPAPSNRHEFIDQLISIKPFSH